jgi:hypothetical protein
MDHRLDIRLELLLFGLALATPAAKGTGRCRMHGGQFCKSPEEYKAWSQNLDPENVLKTFSSHWDVARHRQAEIIRTLGTIEQRAE